MNEQSETSVSSNASVGENQKPNRKENKQISFRVSETEYSKLRQSAETLNMSVPAFVKKKAQGSRLVSPKFDKDTRQSIAKDLSKLGNNVNQIAKTLNSGALASKELSHSDMQNLMKHIQSFRQEVNTLWQQLK